ncbi:outer membrane protein/peptidoglycan-associated (lipo)protein [Opitutaceae bacterium TAV1]|nr:outer membrane protein/peptidoglycan-associated (lipo)protein [Opitutaceae bacterium TAV1]
MPINVIPIFFFPAMNVLLRKALFIAAGSAVLFAAGCKKKPVRPDPGSTVLGQGAGTLNSGNGYLNPTDISGGPLTPYNPSSQVADTGSLLTDNPNTLAPGGEIRGQFQPVYFAFDQSAIRAEERGKVQAAKQHLDANPNDRVLLEGRCDWRGTAEYNLGLGDRRASSVRQYLQDLGVSPSRIEVISKGDLEAVENADAATAAQDRRVDIVILK